jgi:23S rRNA (cytosine1962-C5)-methyltransferase
VNTKSQITCRLFGLGEIKIDKDFFTGKLKNAFEFRTKNLPQKTDCFRLINGEGDFLPGLVIDFYGNGFVCQFLTAGMEKLKPLVLESLVELFSPDFIFERSDSEARKQEGLQQTKGLLFGKIAENLVVSENGTKILVDLENGQKTGFFLDQRQNRKLMGSFAKDKKVLDCFSYTGISSVSCAFGGAKEVTLVDVSVLALETAKKNFELNGLENFTANFVKSDVFQYLRGIEDGNFDLIILDPPKLCKNKQQILQASKGYKDLNLQAMKKIAKGGFLFTFSCSAAIDDVLFGQIIFAAASDCGRKVQILQELGHSFDHPISVYHREGKYLKGLLIRVL